MNRGKNSCFFPLGLSSTCPQWYMTWNTLFYALLSFPISLIPPLMFPGTSKIIIYSRILLSACAVRESKLREWVSRQLGGCACLIVILYIWGLTFGPESWFTRKHTKWKESYTKLGEHSTMSMERRLAFVNVQRWPTSLCLAKVYFPQWSVTPKEDKGWLFFDHQFVPIR